MAKSAHMLYLFPFVAVSTDPTGMRGSSDGLGHPLLCVKSTLHLPVRCRRISITVSATLIPFPASALISHTKYASDHRAWLAILYCPSAQAMSLDVMVAFRYGYANCARFALAFLLPSLTAWLSNGIQDWFFSYALPAASRSPSACPQPLYPGL